MRLNLCGLIMLAILPLSAQVPLTPPPGFVVTSFFGTPIVMPLLATYMNSWEVTVENQSLLSLVNQGDSSPALISAEALKVAQVFCAGASNAPVPDCANPALTIAPIQAKLSFEAGLVPTSQWSPSTYNPHLPSSLAMATAVAAAPTPPPAPPSNLPLIGTCFQVGTGTMCNAGPGASLANIHNGEIVADQAGNLYTAHIVQGLIGQTLYFTPVPAAATPSVKVAKP